MIGSIVVVVAALIVAITAGAVWRHRSGRLRTVAAGASALADVPAVSAARGPGVTLVQFSSPVCTYCEATRRLLAELHGPDIATVELDATEHLDLTRDLKIMRTPTVVVLDADGIEVGRISGAPRRTDLQDAITTARTKETIR